MIAREMLVQLIGQVDTQRPCRVLQATNNTVDEVILESDIDGTRYYVVRSRPCDENRIHLSPRERAIAQLIARGLPNKCIAKQLEISPWTVATYLRRIFAKLEVNTRSAAIARLFQENIL